MSDSDGAPAPDFLDRLIARHAPAAAGPRPGVVKVRPRLPGPFERVEAVRSTATAPDDGSDLLRPAATPSDVRRDSAPRPATPATRSHTERERTVVRTEHTPADPAPRPAARALPEAPLLRPVAPLAPGPRPAPDAVQRTAGRGRPERGAAQTAASVPNPPGTDAATSATVSSPLRPSAADTAAARDAVRQAAARRPGRPPEQVVQVQIGRLEVTAGASPSGGTRQRTSSAARPGTTLSLAEYLARGRE
ncbi:hypothetical protein [Streptomyces sp. NPDC056464]|uniref:hypothetical protein n=1 Tax=Streptomyces sp. NPDC056464 TaxID=3345828 RepID=UPI003695E24C